MIQSHIGGKRKESGEFRTAGGTGQDEGKPGARVGSNWAAWHGWGLPHLRLSLACLSQWECWQVYGASGCYRIEIVTYKGGDAQVNGADWDQQSLSISCLLRQGEYSGRHWKWESENGFWERPDCILDHPHLCWWVLYQPESPGMWDLKKEDWPAGQSKMHFIDWRFLWKHSPLWAGPP